MREHTLIPHVPLAYGQLWNGSFGNFDNNRSDISEVIIHSTAGSLESSISHFQNPQSNVSCHYIVSLDGKIYSMVPESKTAYHSGNYEINKRSIGVEFVGNDSAGIIRTDALYNSGIALLADIMKYYNIPVDEAHIRLHREIVATKCPETLSRLRLIDGIKNLQNPVSEMHTYQLPEKVFVDMVTKGTNLDNLLTALQLSPSLGAEADSYKQVLAYIQNFITAEVSKRAPALATPEVPPVPEKPNGASIQSKSIWKKDVSDILNNIWNAVRRKST